MKPNIGLQLYSLREKCDENFENVLKKLYEVGYDGVEFYSFFDIDAKKMKKLLDNYNLKSMGTHTSFDLLQNDLDGLMRYSEVLGNKFIALAYHDSEDRDGWLRLSEILEKSGDKLRRNGFKCLYHNHGHEFEKKHNGEMPIDIILKNTSPENVSLEVDCYWAKVAGLDPVEFVSKNIDRIKTIHIKDMAKDAKKMTEVGTGIIDCAKLYAIGEKAGFDWVVLEQDEFFIDPFESVKISIDNARRF